MPRTSRPLWLRLSLTYVGVALLAVLLLAAITAFATERYVNVLVKERRDGLTQALLVDTASTYSSGRAGWSDADLRPALDLAARSGTDVAVVANDGKVVATTFSRPRRVDDTQQQAIRIGGRQVGTLYVHFNGRGLVASADELRRSLLRADAWSAGVAALVALGAAVLVARRLSAPVRSLTAAASAISSGNRNARVDTPPGVPTELGELASTFNRMADTMVREEQLRRDLVADVAHELRTPVAVLQANSEALLDGVVPHTPEQTASLHEEILRLATMVNDLQSLASAEAAALHLDRQSCDLAAIAETAVATAERSADVAGISLTADLQPAYLDGDPLRVHQIVTNLLSNALKFTGSGGAVTVAVDATERDARLVVSDTGPGIPADELPHVFDRFWRGPGTSAPGTGIGLSIVQGLVRAHEGEVSIDSNAGAGTRVTVTFPRAEHG
jgi:two-component system sensor histidine kinase BaeS